MIKAFHLLTWQLVFILDHPIVGFPVSGLYAHDKPFLDQLSSNWCKVGVKTLVIHYSGDKGESDGGSGGSCFGYTGSGDTHPIGSNAQTRCMYAPLLHFLGILLLLLLLLILLNCWPRLQVLTTKVYFLVVAERREKVSIRNGEDDAHGDSERVRTFPSLYICYPCFDVYYASA